MYKHALTGLVMAILQFPFSKYFSCREIDYFLTNYKFYICQQAYYNDSLQSTEDVTNKIRFKLFTYYNFFEVMGWTTDSSLAKMFC